MNNVLPAIRRSVSHREEDKNAFWRPAAANARTGKISQCLESMITKESTIKITYGQNVLPMKPPNERHRGLYFSQDDSTLKAALAETPDPTHIVYIPPPSLTRKTIIKDTSCGNCLIVRMVNTLPYCLDLFVQRKLTIASTTVFPMRQCEKYGGVLRFACFTLNVLCMFTIFLLISRLVAGTIDPLHKEDELHVWFCSGKRATIITTNRQEFKDFTFQVGLQIGLEVEMQDERVRFIDTKLQYLWFPFVYFVFCCGLFTSWWSLKCCRTVKHLPTNCSLLELKLWLLMD
jgi:hypothetical protein